MVNYFKKFFLIFLLIGLPSAYAMENKYQTILITLGNIFVPSLGDTIRIFSQAACAPLALYGIPYLYNKLKKYDYTIQSSSRRILDTGNFDQENCKIIQRYLERGNDPNISGEKKITPLMFAAKHQNHELINSLLSNKNTKVNTFDKSGKTAFHYAYESLQQNPETFNNQIVTKLLESGANPNIFTGQDNESPLTLSTKFGKNDLICPLLENNANVNFCNKRGETPLSILTNNILKAGNTNIQKANYTNFKNLLTHGAEIYCNIGENGETPLTEAIINENLELVNFLIKNKVGIDVYNKSKKTPFSIIINNILQEQDDQKQKINYTILKDLIVQGLDINSSIGCFEETALIKAVRQKNVDLVNFLLDNKANVNVPRGKYKETALKIVIKDILNIFPKKDAVNNYNYIMLGRMLYQAKKDEIEKDFTVDFDKVPLIEAIKNQDIVLINLLLHYNVGINDHDKYRKTPLSIALQKALETNNFKIVKRLLECKADPNINMEYGDTPLIIATRYQDFEMVKLLLDCNADISADNYLTSPLFIAVCKNNLKIAEYLLKHKANPDRHCPLIVAIENQNLNMVELLLKHKANINIYCDNGYTPLSMAIEIALKTGNNQIVKYLLRQGAEPNINVNSTHAKRPLLMAIENQNFKMIELLLKHKANINISYYENTPLLCAIETDNLKIVEYLLQQGAIFNSGENQLLIKAIKNQNLDMIKFLMEKGVSVNSFNCWGNSLSHAINTGNVEIVEFLLKNDANPNSSNWENPLILAVRKGNLDIIKLLIKYKADVNTKGTDSFSNDKIPLSFAISYGNLEAVKVLCQAGSNLIGIKSNLTVFDLLTLENKSKDYYIIIITHARFDQEFHQKYNDPIREAIELLLIFKKGEKEKQQPNPPKDLHNLILSKLHQDPEVFKKKISRELFVITSKDPILMQVNNNVKHLLYILKQSKNPVLPYGLDLENDFNTLITAFFDLQKSNIKLSPAELISLLDQKLPNNLAFQIYKNCALLENEKEKN